MAVKTRTQLKTANSATFGNGKNTRGDSEVTFNEDQLDSIVMRKGDTFEADAEFAFQNGSKLREGAIPHGYGGGIARVCANEKADQWEDGVRYLISTTGSSNTVVYAESINNVIPDNTYDSTDSYAIGSRFKNLVTGIEYVCTDATEDIAVWQAQSGVINSFNATDDRAFTSINSCSLRYYRIGTVVYCTLYGDLDFNYTINVGGRILIAAADLPIPTTTLIPTGIATLDLNADAGVYSNVFLNGTDICIQIVSSDSTLTGSGANYSVSFSYEIN